jgi:DNA polymerase I-like protein with 3'-5' exonuclease and polymerase domains
LVIEFALKLGSQIVLRIHDDHLRGLLLTDDLILGVHAEEAVELENKIRTHYEFLYNNIVQINISQSIGDRWIPLNSLLLFIA